MSINLTFVNIIFTCFFVSCTSTKKEAALQNTYSNSTSLDEVKINHASGFEVVYSGGYKIVKINQEGQANNQTITYVLRHQNTAVNDSIAELGSEIIIPLQSIICNSTTHLALLEVLGIENKLKGFAQIKYIYSEKINALVELGKVQEVGIEAKMNVEKVLDINPNAVMAFNAGQEDKQLTKLKELGINVLINADYMEKSLLGRAEWLKYVAVFFDKEKEANQYFDSLVIRYNSMLSLVTATDKPTVMSGTVYGSTWFMPAGKNYNAKLIADAAGQYKWEDDMGTGWLNLDFEVVYDKAANAQYWIGAADFKSLQSLKDVDTRYADFEAFKNANVYTYTARINGAGANDYFESGNIHPDLILADHIKILHPDLLPDYKLYYYRVLDGL